MSEPSFNLDLPAGLLQPNYFDGTIGNVPATIASVLGVPFDGLNPLTNPLWQPLAGAKRVVLLIIDAMGWNLIEKERENLGEVLERTAVSGQITSIFPSTTVAALSSLWTGLGPAQHGLAGLSLFMPEYAATTQMLKFTPTFGNYPDALIDAGLEPDKFLYGSGFAEQLAQSEIPTYSFKGREIVDSALSKMHGRGVADDIGILSFSDLMVQMRLLLEAKQGEPLYACGYWPIIDSMSHVYGWDHEAVAVELHAIFRGIQTEIFQNMSAAARKDTVFFIVADHGQTHTPRSQEIYLEDHPALKEMLFMRPAGEPRTPYLYAKHGHQQNIINYINEELNHAMVAMTSEKALHVGLLGPYPHAPAITERTGDVLATMRDGYLLLTEKERESGKIMRGRHGGMTVAEMEVPWFGFKLDE